MKSSRSYFLGLAKELSDLTGLNCSVSESYTLIRVQPNKHGCIWLSSISKIDSFCRTYDFLWFVDFKTGCIVVHL